MTTLYALAIGFNLGCSFCAAITGRWFYVVWNLGVASGVYLWTELR